jgi:hypothetical protein
MAHLLADHTFLPIHSDGQRDNYTFGGVGDGEVVNTKTRPRFEPAEYRAELS